MWIFKGALWRFGEEITTQMFSIYNINEVIIQTITVTEHSPGHHRSYKKWQGPPNINKVKQHETVLFIQLIQS